jgi:hypothetical protein
VRVLLTHNCSMTAKGLVFRKRLDREFTFDPYEMAVDDGSLELARLFLAAGYPASGSQCVVWWSFLYFYLFFFFFFDVQFL